MDDLTWQKSTFSGGPEGECLYLAPTPTETIRLRESDTPHVILTAAPRQPRRPPAEPQGRRRRRLRGPEVR